jgi:imidazolonepropionase-like amidohydrolase
MEKQIGAVEPGRYADLIAVQGDPLQSIEAIKQVRFVMKGGHVFVGGSRPGAAREVSER